MLEVNLRKSPLQASSGGADDLPQGAEGLAQEVLQGKKITIAVSQNLFYSNEVPFLPPDVVMGRFWNRLL